MSELLDNLFAYPQESERAPHLEKLVFIAAANATDELTDSERRVVICIADFYRHDEGTSRPGHELLAHALGFSHRHLIRLCQNVVEKGWLTVEDSPFPRGRGHAVEYRPNPEKVTARLPYHEIARRRGWLPAREREKGDSHMSPFTNKANGAAHQKGDIRHLERVTSEPERVTSEARKGDTAMSPHLVTHLVYIWTILHLGSSPQALTHIGRLTLIQRPSPRRRAPIVMAAGSEASASASA